jgi:hypothetical protein
MVESAAASLDSSLAICVSTVSIVCAIKAPFQSGPKLKPSTWLLTRPLHMVADTADGADGVRGIGSLTHAIIVIIRIPQPPPRPTKTCARQPGECAGALGQPDRLTPTCKRSDVLSVHCTLASSAPRSLTLSEPHARASAVFLNKFDPGGF